MKSVVLLLNLKFVLNYSLFVPFGTSADYLSIANLFVWGERNHIRSYSGIQTRQIRAKSMRKEKNLYKNEKCVCDSLKCLKHFEILDLCQRNQSKTNVFLSVGYHIITLSSSKQHHQLMPMLSFRFHPQKQTKQNERKKMYAHTMHDSRNQPFVVYSLYSIRNGQ